MVVGTCVFELHLPWATSLKQKRSVVHSLVDRFHKRLRVSTLESGHHELHQRTEIAVAFVARNDQEAERLLERIRESVDDHLDCELVSWQPELLSELT